MISTTLPYLKKREFMQIDQEKLLHWKTSSSHTFGRDYSETTLKKGINFSRMQTKDMYLESHMKLYPIRLPRRYKMWNKLRTQEFITRAADKGSAFVVYTR